MAVTRRLLDPLPVGEGAVSRYIFKNKWKTVLVSCIDFLGGIIFSPLRLRKDAPDPSSILVVRIDQVGDMIQALPFFTELRQKYPAARITALCAAPAEFLLRHCSSIDSIIVMESSWFYSENKTSFHEILRVSKAIRKAKVDLAFDLRGDLRNIIFLFLSGARRISGYGWTGGGFLLAKEVKFHSDDHEIDKNLRLIDGRSQHVIALTFGGMNKANGKPIEYLILAAEKKQSWCIHLHGHRPKCGG